MDTVIRAFVIYVFLLVVFRVAGERTLAKLTSFDLVLTLIISEAVQQGMITDDYSVTNALLLVVTLMGMNILISLLKQKSNAFSRLVDGTPVVIVREGRAMKDRMQKMRVDEDDVLAAAREHRGLQRLDQIEYAVVEAGGAISIIPKPPFRD